MIMGGLGSGKTSGSGALLAKHYLTKGFGGLVLTAKEDELDLWKSRCDQYNRLDDLIVIGHNSNQYFNFLDYESSRPDIGTGINHNIADTLKTVIKAGANDGQESDKAFWDNALQQLLVNAVDLALLTQKKIRFEHIYKIVQSAPKSKNELASETWRKNSQCFQCMHHAAKLLNNATKTERTDELARRLHIIEDFFFGNWLYLSEKTRSIVEQMFFGFGDRAPDQKEDPLGDKDKQSEKDIEDSIKMDEKETERTFNYRQEFEFDQNSKDIDLDHDLDRERNRTPEPSDDFE